MTNFRKRLLIIIGVPLGISLILTTILFFVGSNISKRTDQIRQLRRDLLFRTQLTESLALLRKDSQQAKNYVVEIENILPNRDQLVSFPRDLSTIARQTKVELNSSLGQENSEGIGKLRQTDFTITSQGPFDNFIDFLKSLETARYFINLKSIDFTRQDNNFSALLTGRVFSF